MNFDTLNEVEMRFQEIAGFYACLNANPFEALALLLENPATQRQIEGGWYRPLATTKAEVLRGYEVPKIRLFQSANPPGKLSCLRLDCWALRRYEPEKPQSYPNAGQGYKVGHKDVLWWVSFARLVPLREELPERLRRELSEVEKEVREIRLAYFARLLDTVTEQVTTFDGKTRAAFLEEVNDDNTGYLKIDWEGIFQAAKSLVSEAWGTVGVFRAVMGEYMLAEGKKKSQPPDEPPKTELQRRPSTVANYSSFPDLLHDPDDFYKCLEALRKIDPPVLSDTGNWIGGKGSKSILVAWIEVLEQRGHITRMPDRVALSRLLNAYFPGLKLDTKSARIFRTPTQTYNKYHADFLALIK